MTTKRLVERIAFARGSVDRTGQYPVIRDVLLCGPDSRNGRRYEAKAFAGRKLYEGRPVYVNHADRRTVEAKLGWVESERRRADGMPVGDVAINPRHPLAEQVLWVAEHKPDQLGMSHVCDARTRYEGGTEVVEDVTAVESVDLVADPATTKGFHESTSGGRRMKLREYLDKWAPRLGLKRVAKATKLAEMDEVGDVVMPEDAPAPDAAAADPDAAIDAAFGQAMHGMVDGYLSGTLDLAALLSKLKELAKAHGKVTGGDAAEEAEEPDAEKPEEKPAESRKPKGDPLREALDVCRRLGWKGYDADDLEAIAEAAPARREPLARRLMAASLPPAERVESAGRHQTGQFREEQAAAKDAKPAALPDDPKAVAKWLTEAN